MRRFLTSPKKKPDTPTAIGPEFWERIAAARPDYPSFPPPPPEIILSERDDFSRRLKRRGHPAPKGQDDTPLFAMYRLYEYLILYDNIGIRNELQHFWFNKWPVSSIPDPDDSESPSRYAVLACIPPLMVASFNRRVDLGFARWLPPITTDAEWEEAQSQPKAYETTPAWISSVKPLEQTLKIPFLPYLSGESWVTLESFEDPRASRQLQEKNILCWQPDIYFV